MFIPVAPFVDLVQIVKGLGYNFLTTVSNIYKAYMKLEFVAGNL